MRENPHKETHKSRNIGHWKTLQVTPNKTYIYDVFVNPEDTFSYAVEREIAVARQKMPEEPLTVFDGFIE